VVTLRIGALGPLYVLEDRREVVVAAGRQRGLLACLALAGNHLVTLDELAETVWDGHPPAAAPATLRNLVRRLRSVLGPTAADRLKTRRGGYEFVLGPQEFDVTEFEQRCRAAFALAAGERLRRREALADALALWRGRPLADIESQTLRDAWLPRLDQLRSEALERRIEEDLHLGRHVELVPELRDLTRDSPLNERVHAQLMLALARCGRRSEALGVYRRVRGVLVDELGVEPGAELRSLHERILAGEQALTEISAEIPAQIPVEISAAGEASAGDEAAGRTGAVAPVLAPAPAPALATVVSARRTGPHTLPAAAGLFVGREREVESVCALAGRPPAAGFAIATVDGMGGVGKTALVVEVAHRIAERFPDGQLFVDLHGHALNAPPSPPGEVLGGILQLFGVPAQLIPPDTEARGALYRDRLAGSRTLIVLDSAADEKQIRPLLPGAGDCMVLVTSRKQLKGLDDAFSLTLEVLPPAQAVTLFRQAAGPDRTTDAALVAEIVALCGYLPLALRIAAALLRHRAAWGMGELAERLRVPASDRSRLSDGERNLGAILGLSLTTLSEQARLLVRRVGLGPGPETDRFAAAQLLGTDPATAEQLLQDLVDHSLLTERTAGRYRMHDLVRAHAQALATSIETEQECERAVAGLLDYYCHAAESAAATVARLPRRRPGGAAPAHLPPLADNAQAWDWLRAERTNLDAAFDYALAHGLDTHVVALGSALAEQLWTDGPWSRAVTVHGVVAGAAERIDAPARRADALIELGMIRRMTSSHKEAVDALAQALEIHRAIGDRLGEANALFWSAHLMMIAGDFAGSAAAFTAAQPAYRELGERLGEAAVALQLAACFQVTGDLEDAERAVENALTLQRGLGNGYLEATSLCTFGLIRQAAGDHAAAITAFERAIAIVRELGSLQPEAACMTLLASARRQTGDLQSSLELHEAALECYRDIGDLANEPWALNQYAATIADTGDTQRALDVYLDALEKNRLQHKPDDEGISAEGIGECLLTLDDAHGGAEYLALALDIYVRLGMSTDEQRVRARLSRLG
jgi:DNA-binding SARP family transcriptional activator/tetratricopeptide (TPR) repeat protein